MTWGRKSRLGLCALAAATLGIGVAAPAAASPPGVDEYQLNLPDAGGGSPEPSAPEPTPTAPAVTPTTPVYTTPEATTTVAPTSPPDKPEPQRAIVHGDTSLNATVGPQTAPPLKLRADGQGLPWTTIALAALAALLCVVAIWRLRYLRELPASPRRRPATGATPGS